MKEYVTPRGVNSPNQTWVLKLGTTASVLVGRSGHSDARLGVDVDNARSRPDSLYGLALISGLNAIWTSPAITALSEGEPPLYGTWMTSMPVRCLKISMARLVEEPRPADE